MLRAVAMVMEAHPSPPTTRLLNDRRAYSADGHSEYFGQGGETVVSPPMHEVLAVAATSSRDGLVEHLARHGQGKTSYVEMSRGLAQSGVEKWTFDTSALTIAYYDKAGNELLVEAVR
jgi:uncharacterized protein YbcV (DUF1398 family)